MCNTTLKPSKCMTIKTLHPSYVVYNLNLVTTPFNSINQLLSRKKMWITIKSAGKQHVFEKGFN